MPRLHLALWNFLSVVAKLAGKFNGSWENTQVAWRRQQNASVKSAELGVEKGVTCETRGKLTSQQSSRSLNSTNSRQLKSSTNNVFNEFEVTREWFRGWKLNCWFLSFAKLNFSLKVRNYDKSYFAAFRFRLCLFSLVFFYSSEGKV